MDVLVTYDIATATREGERRLTAVAKVCEAYGVRVQKSVFECRLDAARLARLLADLSDTIDSAADSVIVYRFSGSLAAQRQTLGRSAAARAEGLWLV